MFGKAVRIRYCPATVIAHSQSERHWNDRRSGKALSVDHGVSQETGRVAEFPSSSSEGKETFAMTLFYRASLLLALLFTPFVSFAADGGTVRGVITDPLGAVVSGATVELVQGHERVAITQSDQQGNFQLAAPSPGHYQVRASAP